MSDKESIDRARQALYVWLYKEGQPHREHEWPAPNVYNTMTGENVSREDYLDEVLKVNRTATSGLVAWVAVLISILSLLVAAAAVVVAVAIAVS